MPRDAEQGPVVTTPRSRDRQILLRADDDGPAVRRHTDGDPVPVSSSGPRPPSAADSACRTLVEWASAQAGVLQCRRDIGLVEPADIGAGRHDLVDTVEDIVGEGNV